MTDRMALQCFTWIEHAWNEILSTIFPSPKKEEEGVSLHLPDHIIVEILSRLPAEQVLKCRAVCRKWKALTSTSYFSQIHLKRASSIVFVQYCSNDFELELFFLDDKTKEKKKRMIKEVCSYSMVNMYEAKRCQLFCSCNGLIIFYVSSWSSDFFILNPITHEEITLSEPFRGGRGFICGFYFHSLKKEYRLLYVYRKACNCWWYLIGSPQSKNWRKLCNFSYSPRHEAPIISNGFLYWMAQYTRSTNVVSCRVSIIKFNMETEEFQALPHPGNTCSPQKIQHDNTKMQLVQMESDQLLFCGLNLHESYINIWVLEDSANWIWMEKYNVDLKVDLKCSLFSDYGHDNNDIKLVNVQDGQLLLFWSNRGLFRYYLQRKIIRKVEGKIAGKNMSNLTTENFFLINYTKSLESSGFKKE